MTARLDLDAVEALHTAAEMARPGPWKHVEKGRVFDSEALVTAGYTRYYGGDDPEEETPETMAAEAGTDAVGEFIAATITTVPALVRELREARAENEELRNRVALAAAHGLSQLAHPDGAAAELREARAEVERLRGLLADWWDATDSIKAGAECSKVLVEARRCAEKRRAGK